MRGQRRHLTGSPVDQAAVQHPPCPSREHDRAGLCRPLSGLSRRCCCFGRLPSSGDQVSCSAPLQDPPACRPKTSASRPTTAVPSAATMFGSSGITAEENPRPIVKPPRMSSACFTTHRRPDFSPPITNQAPPPPGPCRVGCGEAAGSRVRVISPAAGGSAMPSGPTPRGLGGIPIGLSKEPRCSHAGDRARQRAQHPVSPMLQSVWQERPEAKAPQEPPNLGVPDRRSELARQAGRPPGREDRRPWSCLRCG